MTSTQEIKTLHHSLFCEGQVWCFEYFDSEEAGSFGAGLSCRLRVRDVGLIAHAALVIGGQLERRPYHVKPNEMPIIHAPNPQICRGTAATTAH